ncbi:MAG: hypothetical protein Q4G24_08675 [Paracoccus sp. (in: a-proteobacteria)]|uniref:hypothetical protein n=1 Tax=Paracoccus sp. TaxID=267 RepID=UPI0026DEB0DB|nr:hypothetical protein [Paracoccus sp. (in: a-proteobacteria)]MDO5621528.1 hypothetical protein [Paracoccus sp. (in: a-proteobacteria)]
MRLSLIAAAAAMTALSGCVVPVATTTPTAPTPTATPATGLTAAARATARNVINTEMAARLPGVNTQPYTDCVVSNASLAELADLAGLQGKAGAADAVAGIVKRPATTQCIARVAATA